MSAAAAGRDPPRSLTTCDDDEDEDEDFVVEELPDSEQDDDDEEEGEWETGDGTTSDDDGGAGAGDDDDDGPVYEPESACHQVLSLPADWPTPPRTLLLTPEKRHAPLPLFLPSSKISLLENILLRFKKFQELGKICKKCNFFRPRPQKFTFIRFGGPMAQKLP